MSRMCNLCEKNVHFMWEKVATFFAHIYAHFMYINVRMRILCAFYVHFMHILCDCTFHIKGT